MRIKTVSVTYGRKVNLGEYNSATIECSMWADLDAEDNLDAAMHGLWDAAKENVKAQCLPLVNKGKAEVREFYLGLPVANPQTEVEEGERCQVCGALGAKWVSWSDAGLPLKQMLCEDCKSKAAGDLPVVPIVRT